MLLTINVEHDANTADAHRLYIQYTENGRLDRLVIIIIAHGTY